MAKGYLVAHIRVHDKDAFEEFKQLSGAAIKAYNGKVLVRNPSPDYREGSAEGLAIVIEFESIDAARAFYESDAYMEARSVREKISDTDLILVEGL
ncbi:DUF1330 domain-containing protein [Flavimaricola sp.]|nr:DUF1330 domain-containing protein [Flavimaricola sp.]MDA9020392.1 DUF1330 domain-containing protein [Flavimaricola sp.]